MPPRRPVTLPNASLALTHSELAAEWHPTRNGGRTPEQVTRGSNAKVWWRCTRCTHSWQAVVASRAHATRPAGCPSCARARRGASLRRYTIDDLRAHATARGGECLATEYAGVLARYPWRCGSCEHRWAASWNSLVNQGTWCNVCSSAQAGLKTRTATHELLAAHAEALGGAFLGDAVTTGRAKYPWRCAAGHTWEASWMKVQSGQWCPTCGRARAAEAQRGYGAADLHRIAAERGGAALSPAYLGAHAPHRWACGDCGHEWEATFNSVRQGTWCPSPACKGQKMSESLTRTTLDDLQAHAVAQGGECLADAYAGPHGRYTWRCAQQHRWEASWASVGLQGTWCPICSDSRLARAIAAELSDLGVVYIAEHRFPDCRNPNTGYQLPFDFYLPDHRVAIEADGIQHFQPVDRFGGAEAFARVQHTDGIKTAYCAGAGIRLLRIPYTAQARVGLLLRDLLHAHAKVPVAAAGARRPRGRSR